MFSADMYDPFTTVYPYAAFAIPLVAIVAIILCTLFVIQRIKTDSFQNIFYGLSAALILPILFVGTLTAAFLSMNEDMNADHYITGTIVKAGGSGELTLGEGDYIQESSIIFLEDVQSQKMLPLEVTTANIQYAVGETITLSCDVPAGQSDIAIPCTVTAMH